MNVKPGGKQPKMHDTMCNGKLYSMVITKEGPTKGQPKGMKLVLEDRGKNTDRMNADKTRAELRTHHDFMFEKTKLETLLLSYGYQGFFLPKFHCELNPIERVWAIAKNIPGRIAITPSRVLSYISVLHLMMFLRKFFRKMRDYVAAYKEGLTAGPDLEKAVKKYKSHRKIYNVNTD